MWNRFLNFGFFSQFRTALGANSCPTGCDAPFYQADRNLGIVGKSRASSFTSRE